MFSQGTLERRRGQLGCPDTGHRHGAAPPKSPAGRCQLTVHLPSSIFTFPHAYAARHVSARRLSAVHSLDCYSFYLASAPSAHVHWPLRTSTFAVATPCNVFGGPSKPHDPRVAIFPFQIDRLGHWLYTLAVPSADCRLIAIVFTNARTMSSTRLDALSEARSV
ncbi:hypothetical protein EVAR_98537_1 [Eumeta japonica]|uniref:Uncharacterized protein n=1 Tax=Eumeta variegata TaxID=151549 RepID=A0A4C1YHX1_EUMVA|nr:hypothetical protein EVAR_98537_1 [Eumeta japonica]